MIPDDLKRVAPSVLEHRMLVAPDAQLRGVRPTTSSARSWPRCRFRAQRAAEQPDVPRRRARGAPPLAPPRTSRTTTLTRRGWSLTGAAFGLVIGSYLLGTVEMLVLGIAAFVLRGRGRALAAVPGAADPRGEPSGAPRSAARGLRGPHRPAGREPRHPRQPLLAATDWFDEGRRAARFLVPPLAAGATARPRTASPPADAAGTAWDRSSVAVTDPFGLARRSEPSAGEAELVVRPRVHDIVAPVAVGSRISAEHEASAARGW